MVDPNVTARVEAMDADEAHTRILVAAELLDAWQSWAVDQLQYDRHSDRPDTAYRLNELRIALGINRPEKNEDPHA